MLHPLASLWRHSGRVTFYESGGQAGQNLLQGSLSGSRRRFRSTEEAHGYLRFWIGEPAARAELKWVLQRSGPSLANSHAGHDGWLQALAGRLANGAIVVLEEVSRQAMPGRLVAPPAAALSAAAIAKLPSLSDMPALAAPINLLPALEDIRIEGAQVLPELDQSLEQVKAAIASVSQASLSLEPAPSKVADIMAAVSSAAAASSSALGAI